MPAQALRYVPPAPKAVPRAVPDDLPREALPDGPRRFCFRLSVP